MKLNSKGKEELRSFISEEVVMVPKGQRIHLDKDLLDELLFEELVIKKQYSSKKYKKDVVIKVPVWSGEFLSKIDLSEISFEGVCFDSGFIDGMLLINIPWITFKNTNAVINLDEIYKSSDAVVGCNLSGTKVIGKVGTCSMSDLSNCGLTAENFDLDYLSECGGRIAETIFANNDLRGLNIANMDLLIPKEERDIIAPNSFQNTGVSLTKEVFSEFTEFLKYNEEYSSKDLVSTKSCVQGCYVDGKLYDSQKGRKSLTARVLGECERQSSYEYKRRELLVKEKSEFLKEKISVQVNSMKKYRVRK